MHIRDLEYKPLISVVMPIYETPEWATRGSDRQYRRLLGCAKSPYSKRVGGLNETDLAVPFRDDVDFCLKVRKRGYRNVWTPHAELYQNESASRGTENTPEKLARFRDETRYMFAAWGPELQHDPLYSDNFSSEIGRCFQLAFPASP